MLVTTAAVIYAVAEVCHVECAQVDVAGLDTQMVALARKKKSLQAALDRQQDLSQHLMQVSSPLRVVHAVAVVLVASPVSSPVQQCTPDFVFPIKVQPPT